MQDKFHDRVFDERRHPGYRGWIPQYSRRIPNDNRSRFSARDRLGQTVLFMYKHISQLCGGGALSTVNPNGSAYYYGLPGSSTSPTAVLDCGVVVNANDLTFTPATLVFTIAANSSAPSNVYAGFGKGTLPFASSNHPGTVSVAYCDGRAKTLSTTVGMNVYATIMSSGGARQGQAPIGDSTFL